MAFAVGGETKYGTIKPTFIIDLVNGKINLQSLNEALRKKRLPISSYGLKKDNIALKIAGPNNDTYNQVIFKCGTKWINM